MANKIQQGIFPLPPLEYCRIQRAAELLRCEVDDIVHWGVVGAIELGVLIPRTKSKKVALVVEKGLWPINSYSLEEELSSIGSSPRKDEGHWENNGVSWLFSIEPSDTHSIHNGGGADSFTGVACGVFAVADGVLIDIESQGYYSGDLWIFPADTGEDIDQAKVSGLVMADKDTSSPMEECEQVTLKSQDLWITRSQMEKLHHHMVAGTPFPNIYNEPELGERVREQRRIAEREQAEPRMTNKQARMIKALILLNPELKQFVDAPHSLLKSLTEQCASAGIACPVSDGKTLADWLDRASDM